MLSYDRAGATRRANPRHISQLITRGTLAVSRRNLMTAHFSRRLFLPFAGLSMIALMRVSALAETPTVDGEPITEDDIVQRTRLLSMSTHKLSERQDVINLLTDEKSRVRDAEKYGVGPTNEDVDRAYLE